MIGKTAVVIQGPISWDTKYLEYSYTDPIIWSTWKGEDAVKTRFPVIYNEKPERTGKQNVMLQAISTYEGALMAKQMGYEYVLKMRSDQYPTGYEQFISSMDKNAVNVLFYNFNKKVNLGYYVDYFAFGKINDILDIWNPDLYRDDKFAFPEHRFTENIIRFDKKINCIGSKLTRKNDVIWQRRGKMIRLSSYKDHADFFDRNREV